MYQRVQSDSLFIILGVTTFTLGYVGLQMPGGKVIRDRYDRSLALPIRWVRRAVPFLGLAVPILIAK